jgi:hypothetical protein
MANTVNAATSSSAVFTPAVEGLPSLTPDAMVIYLQTRLGSIDAQIDAAFQKQNVSESKRKDLMAIQKVANLGPDGGTLTKAQLKEIATLLDHLETTDKKMAKDIRNELADAGIDLKSKDKLDIGADASTSFGNTIGNRLKDIGASAELDMIQLQQLMGQRQTAISLATNFCAAMGKSLEAIVQNCG